MGAAQAMEEARSLDGQDRFLNGKAAKYWLRAGEVKKAEDLISLFTKVRTFMDSTDVQKDMTVVADLTDLQCLWFLQEEGDSYKRIGNLALALKRYQAVAAVSLAPYLAELRLSANTRTTNTISTLIACVG